LVRDILLWYFLFSLITATAITFRTWQYAVAVKTLGSFLDWLVYLGVIFIGTFLFSPMFFVIFIFKPEVYKKAVITHLFKE